MKEHKSQSQTDLCENPLLPVIGRAISGNVSKHCVFISISKVREGDVICSYFLIMRNYFVKYFAHKGYSGILAIIGVNKVKLAVQ